MTLMPKFARADKTTREKSHTMPFVPSKKPQHAPYVEWPECEAFNAELTSRLKAAGFRNPSQLALAAGLAPSTVSGWKHSKFKPTKATLRQVSDALGGTWPLAEMEVAAGLAHPDEVGLDESESAAPLPRQLVRVVALYNRARVEEPRLTEVYLDTLDEAADYLEEQLEKRAKRQGRRPK